MGFNMEVDLVYVPLVEAHTLTMIKGMFTLSVNDTWERGVDTNARDF